MTVLCGSNFKRRLVRIMWFAYAIMWISVSLATCFGIYITKSAWCLWAFLIPMSVKLIQKSNSKNDNEDDEEDEE